MTTSTPVHPALINVPRVPTVHTPCAICGADRWTVHLGGLVDHLTGEQFDIDRCDGCGVLATRPPPAADQVWRFYPPRYRGDRHAFTGRLRNNLRRLAVQRAFPKGFRGRLLDVGCGSGAFARHMRHHGWDVAATEIDDVTVAKLRSEGIDAKDPDEAERNGFDGGPFDAVTSWHVMEHVGDPAGLARWVATQLAPAGVFQATVPNVACLQSRFFGRRWMHLDVPRHRHHFTPKTFAELLTGAGFRVGERTNLALEYDWFGVIQSALDFVCSRRNVLFDHMTSAPDVEQAAAADLALSYTLAYPLAALSLPLLGVGWLVGDGATLTLSCRHP